MKCPCVTCEEQCDWMNEQCSARQEWFGKGIDRLAQVKNEDE